MPTVCHFGSFPTTPAYSRNLSVAQGLTDTGWHVVECRVSNRATGAGTVRRGGGLIRWIVFATRSVGAWFGLALGHRRVGNYDVLLVGYPSHLEVFVAAFLARRRRRPLVMDAFIGLYDTVVCDRGLLKPGRPPARLLRAWERFALRRADRVLVDTPQQADALAADYGLHRDRIAAVPVGIDESLWQPSALAEPDDTFRVAMWATFIPLHGMEVVARAARRLEDEGTNVQIDVIGDGQTADSFSALLDEMRPGNIRWRRGVFDIQAVVDLARRAHCCLGVFGSSRKAASVVPYKVTQAMCLGRPLITCDGPAVRCVLQQKSSAMLVAANAPDELAGAITTLAGDRALCEQLATGARTAYERHLGRAVISRALHEALAPLVNQG